MRWKMILRCVNTRCVCCGHVACRVGLKGLKESFTKVAAIQSGHLYVSANPNPKVTAKCLDREKVILFFVYGGNLAK